jgi:hypothetical protein
MAKLNVQQIRDRALQIVQEAVAGIRYSALVRQIALEHPETPKNTIHGAVWDLDTRYPNLIHKPSRGLYLPLLHGEVPPPAVIEPAKLPREEEFYAPFADWLKSELDEVTVAVPLGGAGLQKKWGTPDVVGVYKPLASRVRAQRFSPDMFYVNEFADRLYQIDPATFHQLFG